MHNEKEYLKSLIEDFPTSKIINVDNAFKLIHFRYVEWDNILIESNFKKYQHKLETLVLLMHFHLYKDIISNAGEYRKNTDKDNGFVGFGAVMLEIITLQNLEVQTH
jgi:hypothetical protein